MQYCVTRVRFRRDGEIDQVEWGPLDGHALVLIADPLHSDVADVMHLVRSGKLVWASLQTPFGLALGSLLRVGYGPNGSETLEPVPGGRLRALRDMARF